MEVFCESCKYYRKVGLYADGYFNYERCVNKTNSIYIKSPISPNELHGYSGTPRTKNKNNNCGDYAS